MLGQQVRSMMSPVSFPGHQIPPFWLSCLDDTGHGMFFPNLTNYCFAIIEAKLFANVWGQLESEFMCV